MSGAVLPGGKQITRQKYFSQGEDTVWAIKKDGLNQLAIYAGNDKVFNIQGGAFSSMTTGGADLGSNTRKWKDFYLDGIIYNSNFIVNNGTNDVFRVDGVNGQTKTRYTFLPYNDNSISLGSSSLQFKDLYLGGYIYFGGTNNYIYKTTEQLSALVVLMY